jgi:hypothetical protein
MRVFRGEINIRQKQPQMTNAEIELNLEKALARFLDTEADLLEIGINERSLTHKLTECIKEYFPKDFDVDCEYNRNGEIPKQLMSLHFGVVGAFDPEGKTVYPDIIVHKRRMSGSNILVIEVKKEKGSSSNDLKKLQFFTSDEFIYKYRFGVFIRFKSKDEKPEKIWFSRGSRIENPMDQ